MSNSKKDHASFQNKYNRASNIGKVKTDKKVNVKGDGTINFTQNNTEDSEDLQKVVNDVLDKSEEE